MDRSNRRRILILVTMVSAPAALLLLVVAASFWNVRSDVSEQRSRFEVPSDASAAQLRRIVQRLHVGPQMETWELRETISALDQVVEQFTGMPDAPTDDLANANACRLFYRTHGFLRGALQPSPDQTLALGREIVASLQSQSELSSDQLMPVTWYLQLLRRHPGDQQTILALLDDLELATHGKLNASAAEQFRDLVAGIRRRLNLPGATIELRGETLAGTIIDVADLRGQVVLVEFWGTSCGPCVAEMPAMKAIYDRYHARGFEIIGVPTDRFPGKLIAFLEAHNIEWPQLFDPEKNLERMQDMGISAIPSSLLLDRRGRVVALDLRAVSSDAELSLEPALVQLLKR